MSDTIRIVFRSYDRYSEYVTYEKVDEPEYVIDSRARGDKVRKLFSRAGDGDVFDIEIDWSRSLRTEAVVKAKLYTGSLEERVDQLEARIVELEKEKK